MILHEAKNFTWYSFALFDTCPGVATFVTTRGGAVAGDTYSSLNMGLHNGDDPSRVEANRKRLCDALGIERLITPRQTHGTDILPVTPRFLSLDAAAQTVCLDGKDAVMTDCPGVAIAVSTADCVPLLLYDDVHRACAAVHAGWRGMAAHIVRLTVEAMASCYATAPASLRVAVGPSIGPGCFEVGDEVVRAFVAAGFDEAAVVRRYPSARPHIDLWAAAVEELSLCGVDLSHIEVAGVCTQSHSDEFFSARASGIRSGRFLTGIYLTDI